MRRCYFYGGNIGEFVGVIVAAFKEHIVLVGGDNEGVLAGICGPAGAYVVIVDVAAACEEEAEVAFFIGFIACEDVVLGGADRGEGFAQGIPAGVEVWGAI